MTLLGGHTTTAPELLVGFSVDGFANEALLSMDRLRVGDRLALDQAPGYRRAASRGHAGARERAGGPVDARVDDREQSERRGGGTGVRGLGGYRHHGLRSRGTPRRRCSAPAESARWWTSPRFQRFPVRSSSWELALAARSTPRTRRPRRGSCSTRRPRGTPSSSSCSIPQTSGGLLFGISEDALPALIARLPGVVVIGEVREARADGAPIEVVAGSD